MAPFPPIYDFKALQDHPFVLQLVFWNLFVFFKLLRPVLFGQRRKSAAYRPPFSYVYGGSGNASAVFCLKALALSVDSFRPFPRRCPKAPKLLPNKPTSSSRMKRLTLLASHFSLFAYLVSNWHLERIKQRARIGNRGSHAGPGKSFFNDNESD